MIELPGPQFISRPGWGGQLHRWWTRDGSTLALFLVIIVAVALVVRFLWVRIDAPLAQIPTPTPSQSIMLYAQHGDGMTALAARALNLYLAAQPANMWLDGAQHLFAVDALAHSVCWCPLEPNQEVAFSIDTINAIIARAQHLSPAQHSAWARLLH